MSARVAMISEHASPLALLGGVDAGGQNIYVDSLSRELAARGYAVDVFTRRDDADLPEIVPWTDGVRVFNITAGPAAKLPKDALWPLMPEFRDAIVRSAARSGRRYDLIHGNFWMSGWAGAALSASWRVPIAQIFHATGVTKRREQGAADTSPPDRIAVERDIVRRVDRLIAQCPAERDELLADYGAPAAKIAVIPSAVDTDRYRPVSQAYARAALGLAPDAELIVYVGRIVPRKDIRNIVRALANLRDRRRAAGQTTLPRLLVVGGETPQPDETATPEIAALRALARELGLLDRVTFVGRKQPDELSLWYAAGDVAVTTPWYEPFGLTPLEAMACATPVVGSRVGGVGFTIVDGETGFLVPPHDPAALADRLELILGDRVLRDRLGQAGRARVTREFTWTMVAARTAALYDELLAAGAPCAHAQLRPVLAGAASVNEVPGGVSA
jgi:glycosyltransferase involved in cell wall biosynthesis